MLWALILYMSGGTYSLTLTPTDRIAEECFLYFCFDVWAEARTLGLRQIRQHAT